MTGRFELGLEPAPPFRVTRLAVEVGDGSGRPETAARDQAGHDRGGHGRPWTASSRHAWRTTPLPASC